MRTFAEELAVRAVTVGTTPLGLAVAADLKARLCDVVFDKVPEETEDLKVLLY